MAAPNDQLAPIPSSGTLDAPVEKLLENWRGVALKASAKHSNASDYYETLDGWYGLASTVLAAVVGSAVFITLQHSEQTVTRAIVGSIGVIAAIASGIQTSAKYGQRAERHRQASRQYGAAVRQIDELRALPPGAADVQTRLDALRKSFDDTGAMAPNVPPRIWNAPDSKPKRSPVKNPPPQTVHADPEPPPDPPKAGKARAGSGA